MLASMIMAREGQPGQPMWGFRVTERPIRHLLIDLAQLPLEKRKKIAGLNPARAVIMGLVIIERIMSHLHVNVAQVHTRGVRDGLLLHNGAGHIRWTAQAVTAKPRGSRGAICQELRRRSDRMRGQSPTWGWLWEQLRCRSSSINDHELIEAAALGATFWLCSRFRRPPRAQFAPDPQQRSPWLRTRAIAIAGPHAPLSPRQPPKSTTTPASWATRTAAAHRRYPARIALALDRTHQRHMRALESSSEFNSVYTVHCAEAVRRRPMSHSFESRSSFGKIFDLKCSSITNQHHKILLATENNYQASLNSILPKSPTIPFDAPSNPNGLTDSATLFFSLLYHAKIVKSFVKTAYVDSSD